MNAFIVFQITSTPKSLPPLPTPTTSTYNDITYQHPQASDKADDVSPSLMSASFNFGVQNFKSLRSEIERKTGLNLSTSEGTMHLHLSNCVKISRCEHHLKDIKSMMEFLTTRPTETTQEDAYKWEVIEDWQAYVAVANGNFEKSSLVSAHVPYIRDENLPSFRL